MKTSKKKIQALSIGGGMSYFIKRNDRPDIKYHVKSYRFLVLGEKGFCQVYSDENETDERIVMFLDEEKSRAYIHRDQEDATINTVFGIWEDENSVLVQGIFMERGDKDVYRMIHWDTWLTPEDSLKVYTYLFNLVCGLSNNGLSENEQLKENYLKLLLGNTLEEGDDGIDK